MQDMLLTSIPECCRPLNLPSPSTSSIAGMFNDRGPSLSFGVLMTRPVVIRCPAPNSRSMRYVATAFLMLRYRPSRYGGYGGFVGVMWSCLGMKSLSSACH